jgi:hypothetical protein
MMTVDLRIGYVGLSEMDEQRLKAVMRMALTNGVLRAKWRMSEAAHAHLVVVAPDSAEGLAMIAAGHQDPGKVFAVLAGESDSITLDCARLPWPIRLENLLALLKSVESKADHADATPAAQSCLTESKSHFVRLAALLRASEDASEQVAWRIAGLHRRSLYVAPGRRVFYFGDSLATLRQINTSIELEFVPIPIEELPHDGGRKPIVMLQWLVGLLTGPLGLLPWISADSAFRLRRFPEFQMLYHLPSHRRIAATLTRALPGMQAVQELTGLDSATIAGFINAANLCGYLTVLDKKVQMPAVPHASTARRALFHSFRKALGIATADA